MSDAKPTMQRADAEWQALLDAAQAEVAALRARVVEMEADVEFVTDMGASVAVEAQEERDEWKAKAEAREAALMECRAVDCECDDDMTSDGHGSGCEYGVTFQKARAEKAEAEVVALREALRSFDRWPTVYEFALAMIRKLDQHAPRKGKREGWSNDEPVALLARVCDETVELCLSIDETPPARVLDEAADVANMAMMLADACGHLRGHFSLAALLAKLEGNWRKP